MRSFFITGVQRSGTTLLAVMLGNHPAIHMESRAIIFRLVTAFNNATALLPHNITVDENLFFQWLVDHDKDQRLRELLLPIQPGESVQHLITRSLESKMQEANRLIWADKAPNLQHYIPDLLRLMPTAKFIHIIRDGRATAYSMARRTPKHLALSAQAWVDGNVEALINHRILGESQFRIVNYEDLVAQPEKTLKSVCDFLDVAFVPDLLERPPTEGAEDYVAPQLDRSKIDQWKKDLSAKEIYRVEKVQASLLARLGYPVENQQLIDLAKPLSLTRRIMYQQIDQIKQLFVSRKPGMRDRKVIEVHRSLSSRIYLFVQGFVRDFFSQDIFKSIFGRAFYRNRKYDKSHSVRKHDST